MSYMSFWVVFFFWRKTEYAAVLWAPVQPSSPLIQWERKVELRPSPSFNLS